MVTRMATGEERLQVLRMVATGKLSPEEAERLLATMSKAAADALPGAETEPATPIKVNSPQTRRFLRIKVEEEGSTRVNVNIPLDLAKLAIQFMPKEARRQLEGVDLDELLEAVRMGAEGKLVEVEDEDTHVEIWID